MAQKSFAEAVELYSTALEADAVSKGGERVVLLGNRSLALLKRGNFEAAERDASEAISLCGDEETLDPCIPRRCTAGRSHTGAWVE